MPEIPYPRGVRDLMPNEALFTNELLKKIESVFQRFGFLTIDTPTFESLKVLKAKGGIGSEDDLIYEIKDEDLGLRYDHTVSLARYMAMHQEMPLPFKRYYIGKVWRKDEPQKNRYREFVQADIDVVGGDSVTNNAEVVAAGASALDQIGIDYEIHISDRRIIEDILASMGIDPSRFVEAERIIDKLDKVGMDKVNELLIKSGIEEETVRQLSLLIGKEGTNEDRLDYVHGMLKDKKPAEELRQLFTLLEKYNLRGKPVFDISLVRGLQYYTGVVFEFKDTMGKVKSSLAGGGRYDKLISLYSGRDVPAVGVSLGVDRILDLMGYSSSIKKTFATVYVAYIKEKNHEYALKAANFFRANGINTDINTAKRNITNQFSYANSLKFQYAAIVGDSEEKESKVKMRNLVTGEESLMSLDEALIMVSGKNK
jgi:histidyl-tRNA synthetase